MKIVKLTRERIALGFIVLLSAALNFTNLAIEGYSNQYYAAAVKSMLVSWKNFFFVALDPAGFVTVDKPPFGFWMQALSAKVFGFSGWSILLPQALAGALSAIVLYCIVKRSFGSRAGLLSALCLAITPVFVAVSRNNTIDNQLVLALLLACWAVSIAAEKGKLKYLFLSMVLIGIGFNIKMLQAYMILPAIYVLYLFSTSVSLPKRIFHLLAGTAVLLAVSFSWALAVDSIPASERPYVGCSGDNSVMGLITGHNGTERLGGIFSIFTGTNRDGGPGGGPGWGRGGAPPQRPTDNNSSDRNDRQQGQPPGFPDGNHGFGQRHAIDQAKSSSETTIARETRLPGGSNMPQPPGSSSMRPSGGFGGNGPGWGPPGGGAAPGGGPGGPGGGGRLAGTFGNQTPAGITRLFDKNVLSDQIVWFIPLALFGFLAAAWREKLRLRLDNKRKQALVLWLMWFLPVFIYFSYNTGLFHSYYLTMLAPPIAALTGIGLAAMWEQYREGGWKAWLLPLALLSNAAVQMLMLSYFYSDTADIIKVLMIILTLLTIIPGVILLFLPLWGILKARQAGALEGQPARGSKFKKVLAALALVGLLVTPTAGSAAAMFKSVGSGMPGAGLELLPDKLWGGSASAQPNSRNDRMGMPGRQSGSQSELIAFLEKHPVNGKGQIVVSSANTAESLTLNSDLYVASLSGFMGGEPVMSLERFQQLVKNGEVRYVLAGGSDGRGGGPGGGGSSDIMNWVRSSGKLVSYGSGQVYDLIDYSH